MRFADDGHTLQSASRVLESVRSRTGDKLGRGGAVRELEQGGGVWPAGLGFPGLLM